MRIIENPNPNDEKILTCEKCSCKFAYNKSDTHSWNNGVLGPGFDGDAYVICPNCGAYISIIERKHHDKPIVISDKIMNNLRNSLSDVVYVGGSNPSLLTNYPLA